MIEALVTLCVFGSFGARKHGDELIGDAYGVEHFVLCITRMHVAALEGDAGAGGVEVLIFQFAYGAAVHGVGEVAAKPLNVKFMCSQTYLLVGVEADANLAVLNLRIGLQPRNGADDFGYAGFVVAPRSVVPSVTMRS